MKIQYDGTNYSGWQIQENAQTVQQVISEKIQQITQQEINLIGSGRTDASVHALGQVANFKISGKLNLFKFQYSLNSILPSDIAITEMQEVSEEFHSRFSAKSRSYLYLISREKSPFYFKYSYFYNSELELEKLNKLTKYFTGEKDFTSFCKVNTEVNTKLCNVYEASWRKTKNIYLFYVEANRFLYGMVRAIVGTFLRAVKMDGGKKYIENIFLQKNRDAAADAVPAKGLFLYKIKY
jgi:tRNA pseudouridine38-40 synthase